jgi:hypothetical protein
MDEKGDDLLAASALSGEQHIGIALSDSVGISKRAPHGRTLGHNSSQSLGRQRWLRHIDSHTHPIAHRRKQLIEINRLGEVIDRTA